MKFIAQAKSTGRCVLKECQIPGSRIYEGKGYRYLACSIVHAEEAERLIFQKFKEMDAEAEKSAG